MPTRRQVLATGLGYLAASALPVWAVKPPTLSSYPRERAGMRRRATPGDIARVVCASDIIIVG
ncbi:hypothetical protein [Salinicola sp. CPA57]|uniref:hypothetical protein n=1 Tax=Salinicola sp. CPA57 TaxID=1949080 RepID=UPI001300B0AB|nr:hypothetical protein [Salinicola sp. CPA57]